MKSLVLLRCTVSAFENSGAPTVFIPTSVEVRTSGALLVNVPLASSCALPTVSSAVRVTLSLSHSSRFSFSVE